MAGKPAPLTLIYDLLVRVVALEKTITWTTREGETEQISNAIARQFAPISGPFPMLLNWVSRAAYTRPNQAVADISLALTVQCIGGPLGAGYAGESEDRLNMMYIALPRLFEENPFLELDGAPLDYLHPSGGVQPREAPIGTTAFEVNDGQTSTRYMAVPFTFDLVLRIPRQRKG